MNSIYAEARNLVNLEDCYFYHTMDLPDYGTVKGEWDLRNKEAAYLGNVDFRGKSVLEIGAASGHLCFYMDYLSLFWQKFPIKSHIPIHRGSMEIDSFHSGLIIS